MQAIPNLEKGRERRGEPGPGPSGTVPSPLPRFYLPRKFSRCSIDEYNQFLQEGGGSCLFNKPLKVPAPGRGTWERGLGRVPVRLNDTSSLSSSWTPPSAETASWRRGKSATAAQCR